MTVGARRSVNGWSVSATNRAFLSSRDTFKKRTTISEAYRACQKAFFKVSAAVGLLEGRASAGNLSIDEIKRAFSEVFCDRLAAGTVIHGQTRVIVINRAVSARMK